jgi:hypothetical protein
MYAGVGAGVGAGVSAEESVARASAVRATDFIFGELGVLWRRKTTRGRSATGGVSQRGRRLPEVSTGEKVARKQPTSDDLGAPKKLTITISDDGVAAAGGFSGTRVQLAAFCIIIAVEH